jgi:hypothetical protein
MISSDVQWGWHWEEQRAQAHHDYGVQQHQNGSKHQGGLLCGYRQQKVLGADDGGHQSETDAVQDKRRQKQRSDQPRVPHA